MITRRDTLEQALNEVEAKALRGASIVVVSRRWWDDLSIAERDAYRHRADRAAVEIRADDEISRHFVEVRCGDEERPLSSERPL
jgi:hypothetical protein